MDRSDGRDHNVKSDLLTLVPATLQWFPITLGIKSYKALQPSAASPTSGTPFLLTWSWPPWFPCCSADTPHPPPARGFHAGCPPDQNGPPPRTCLAHSFTSDRSWFKCHLTWQPSPTPHLEQLSLLPPCPRCSSVQPPPCCFPP